MTLKRLAIATAATWLAAPAYAVGWLDTPAADAAASGIAVVAGWYCSASKIEIQIDAAPPVKAAYGTDRFDTQQVCGRHDTGFGLLVNWAELTPGPHTLRALADGVEFARRAFTVTTYGVDFLRGKSASVTVYDFPQAGRSTVLEWQEAMQSFVAREVRDDAPALEGRWNGANIERRSNCTSPQNNGQHGTYAEYLVANSAGVFTISETAVTGLTCTYNGTYTQDGMQRHAAGSYFCSDGKRGDFNTTGFLVTPTEMQIRMDIKLTGSESCTIDSIIGGSRF